jgi:hypothetical protein
MNRRVILQWFERLQLPLATAIGASHLERNYELPEKRDTAVLSQMLGQCSKDAPE